MLYFVFPVFVDAYVRISWKDLMEKDLLHLEKKGLMSFILYC